MVKRIIFVIFCLFIIINISSCSEEGNSKQNALSILSNTPKDVSNDNNYELETEVVTENIIASDDFSLYHKNNFLLDTNGKMDETLLNSIFGDTLTIEKSEYGASPYIGSTCINIECADFSAIIMESEYARRLLSYKTNSKDLKTYKGISVGNPIDVINRIYSNCSKYEITNSDGSISLYYKISDGDEFGYSMYFISKNGIIEEISVQKSDP